MEANRDKKILIFTETKHMAKDFEKLNYAGTISLLNLLEFLSLHGDLEQAAREQRMKRYRDKRSKSILVATDVASRGLDIDDIDVVIQCGCRHIDSYIHRSGRTGRVGKDGMNILLLERDDLKFVFDLEEQINIKVQLVAQLTHVDSQGQEDKILKDFLAKSK